MKHLSWSNVLMILLFTACTSVTPRHLAPWVPPQGTCCSHPPLFSDTAFHKALFRASLDIRDHHLTGLLFLKKIPDSGYRLVFSNELGMTFFDLGITADRMDVNYCFEPLYKKPLLKILHTDLSLLLHTVDHPKEPEFFRLKGSGTPVSRSKQGNIRRWDVYSPGCDTLREIRGRSNPFEQVIISLTKYSRAIPSRIHISNPVIGMKMSLTLLNAG
jgi:hypothetical protein